MTTATKQWYAKQGSMGQGHIADEETGRSVAIAYDYEDAPLLAAAPDLLEACQAAMDDGFLAGEALDLVAAAIAKATAATNH